MGQVYLKDRDGLTRGFTIAGNEPTASEQARISAALSGQPIQTDSPKEESAGLLGNIGAGIGGGWNRMQAGALGLAGLAAQDRQSGTLFGYTPQQFEQMRAEQNAEAAEYKDTSGGLGGGTLDYLGYQLGQSLPSTAGGVLGATVGTMLLPGAGTVGGFAAGSALAGLASLPQSYNENLETQIDKYGYVKDPHKAFKAAVVQSSLEGVADRAVLGVSGILKGAVPGAVKDLVADATRRGVAKAAKQVGATTLTGVGAEGVTEAVQQAITRWQAEKPLGDEEAQKEYIENAIVGGILGGAMGGAFGAVGAAVDARETKKYDQIKADLAEQDNYGDVRSNILKNREARTRQAAEALAAEEKLSGPSVPLLEDLRSEGPVGLTGPKTVSRVAQDTVLADAAREGGAASTFGDLPASNDNFTTEEYVKAVDAMRNEKLVSPDKIKNSMKIGRTKADAIWKTMLERLDAKPAGSAGQYLTVVGKVTDGKVEDTPSITRRYEARPIEETDIKPYKVIRQGGRQVGPEFKTSEEAFQFADGQKIGDFEVVETPRAKQYGVYEVTSGVQGQKPTSRFVRAYSSDQEARDYAQSQNPAFSPETNQVIADNGRVAKVAAKQKEMAGKYQNNVQALVDKMVGKGKSVVELMETLTAPTGEGIATGNIIEGEVQPLQNGLIRMRVAAGISDPNLSPDQFQNAINSIAHHEVLHVAKEAGLFTPAEWKALVKRANTRVRDKSYTYLERAQVRTQGAPMGATLDEEAVAEMVRDYMRDPTAFENAPRSLLRRLLDFVRTLGGYARDVAAGNNVLGDFASGKLAGRTGNATRQEMYGPYFSSIKIPPFYLKSAKYFEQIAEKTPDLAYPGQQWIGMLSPNKSGISPEEMKWTGLVDWLKDQKKVPVRDILQYLASNSVNIEERVYGGISPDEYDRNDELTKRLQGEYRNDFGYTSFKEWLDFQADSGTGGLREDANELLRLQEKLLKRPTVHASVTQEGGSDYTEMVFHMPHLEPAFSEGFHFDGFPNILAFGRFNTRTLDGKKVLFIEELQSDLHQKGKKQGYTSKSDLAHEQELNQKLEENAREQYALSERIRDFDRLSAEEQSSYDALTNERNQLLSTLNEFQKIKTIPDAPLKTNWSDFVVKRLVRHAAENGFDAISWNGEALGVAQTEQYISDRRDYKQVFNEYTREDGTTGYKTEIVDYGEIVQSQDVTGIVNFYTKRLANDVKKLFNKQEFGNAVPYLRPRDEAKADLDLENLFPSHEDFDIAMGELAGWQAGADAFMEKAYKKAIQVARNQRVFDAQAALDKAGVPIGRMVDDLKEVFPALEEEMGDSYNPNMDREGNPNLERWMLDLTPEIKDVAVNKGFSKFSSIQQNPAPDTPEFRQWFKGSKVVGDDGKPLVVFHGTMKDFDRFKGGRGDAAVGAGFYFTDTPEDASGNYATADGPDPIYKMQSATDELLYDNDLEEGVDYFLDDEGIADIVRRQFADHEGAVMPVYLSIQKPVVLEGTKSTKFTEAEFQAMIDAAGELENEYLNVDAKEIARDINYIVKNRSYGAQFFQREMRGSRGIISAIDPETGFEVGNEIIRRMWEAAGFDGIIMKDVKQRWPEFDNVFEDTTHYIAFLPTQIKSVNNSGGFNPNDARVLYSSVQPTYSAYSIFGTRAPTRPPATTLAEVERRMLYNNIAPTLDKLIGKPLSLLGFDRTATRKLAEGTVIALQDKMQPLAKLIDRVRLNGGFISNETDTYLRNQLMAGVVDQMTEKNDATLYRPITKAVYNLNVSQTDVNELLRAFPSPMEPVRKILENYTNPKLAMAELYLYAQHAKERNRVMRARNDQLQGIRPDQYEHGSGMSDMDADRVLNFIASKPYANQFMDLRNPNSIRSLYRNIIKSTNDLRVDGGLNPDFRTMINPATGRVFDEYQDYAPLRGFLDNNPDHQDELTSAFVRMGKGMKITGKEDKAAAGRQSEASHLIANAVLQNQEAIIRSEKNKVGQTFLAMLNQNMGVTLPSPTGIPNTMADFAEVVPLEKIKPTYDRRSGVVKMTSSNARQDPDMMVVKQGGTEIGIRIKDHRLRAAFLEGSTLGATGQNALTKALLRFNRILAAARTSLNPEFLFSNFFRDLEGAVLNLSELEMKGMQKTIAKDALPAVRGVYNSLRDNNPNNPWRKEFEEFAARGGKTAFMGVNDLDATLARINNELMTDPSGKLGAAREKAKAVFEYIEHWNDAVENGIRVSTYRHLKEKLLSMTPDPTNPAQIERAKNRAAFIAKNLTVNFNMGGTLKPTMNAWYLFFNASLQGSAALVNPLIRSKKVRRFWLAAIAAGALQDIVMSTLSGVGDDGQKEYDKIPEQTLETNMIFLNPFAERGYVKIPMPYLFNAAWNSGRAIMRGLRGGYTMGETANSVFGTVADSVNPWGGGGSWLNYVAPTVLDPMVELVANKNFMEAPIAPPASPYGAGDIPAQRYWNNTSPLYVSVAEWLDTLTGGDNVFPGGVSFSPNQYEYVFEFFGGGAMSTIVRAWDFVAPEVVGGAGRGLKLATGDKDVSANDIPFVRRLVGNITTREDLSGYLDKKERVLTVRGALRDALKDGEPERYQKIMEEYPEEYRLASRINGMETKRRKIGSQIKKIREAKNLTEDQKKKLVEPLKKQQEALVDQANALMGDI